MPYTRGNSQIPVENGNKKSESWHSANMLALSDIDPWLCLMRINQQMPRWVFSLN